MNKLKDFRIQKGLSRNQLGAELGLTSRYIAFLENGERVPSLNTAVKIAAYFNTSIEYIFLKSNCTKSTLREKGVEKHE
ncbi:helix-turn-helix transcriptional regulator [Clostridioides difficile]|uniref:helix-turn-helix transcriptional regulator n=1 Tax=Clostridioides difficile TaxID=1496 RepID=UPI00038D05BF|nr:helix-turn-helix transcriptional regulator [Clostridioides difficile]EGT5508119.1 XRE family transcriptional regulator [Clostridioides difficile]EGT5540674.1 XRE family transcriptional regulator [Clostridioides difficile]EGT5549974.1 XRE family transcriptional regulator [Clostridioides difficile]EGT5553664.1 XRE family transcriptional regulator [Clostridioides difficile]EJA6640744.1 helix-turn-helix transcriptional regulator [Clostridioides difficile]